MIFYGFSGLTNLKYFYQLTVSTCVSVNMCMTPTVPIVLPVEGK